MFPESWWWQCHQLWSSQFWAKCLSLRCCSVWPIALGQLRGPVRVVGPGWGKAGLAAGAEGWLELAAPCWVLASASCWRLPHYWPLGRWLRWLKAQLLFCLSLRCCWCQLPNKHVRPTSWVHDLLDGLPHSRKFFGIIRFMKLLLGKDSSPPCSFGPQRHLVWEANDQLRPCWYELHWAADPLAFS